MSNPKLECDLLILGAGMAGLSAAGWAAQRGARVVVVERAAEVGGSAALSGGMLWTASSAPRMDLYGGGSPALSMSPSSSKVSSPRRPGLDHLRCRSQIWVSVDILSAQNVKTNQGDCPLRKQRQFAMLHSRFHDFALQREWKEE